MVSSASVFFSFLSSADLASSTQRAHDLTSPPPPSTQRAHLTSPSATLYPGCPDLKVPMTSYRFPPPSTQGARDLTPSFFFTRTRSSCSYLFAALLLRHTGQDGSSQSYLFRGWGCIDACLQSITPSWQNTYRWTQQTPPSECGRQCTSIRINAHICPI